MYWLDIKHYLDHYEFLVKISHKPLEKFMVNHNFGPLYIYIYPDGWILIGVTDTQKCKTCSLDFLFKPFIWLVKTDYLKYSKRKELWTWDYTCKCLLFYYKYTKPDRQICENGYLQKHQFGGELDSQSCAGFRRRQEGDQHLHAEDSTEADWVGACRRTTPSCLIERPLHVVCTGNPSTKTLERL